MYLSLFCGSIASIIKLQYFTLDTYSNKIKGKEKNWYIIGPLHKTLFGHDEPNMSA